MSEMTTTGPHDLVITSGDCWFTALCSCGHGLGGGPPSQTFDVYATAWERHVMTDHRDCACDWHQL